jgi:signal transduction histidine kinase
MNSLTRPTSLTRQTLFQMAVRITLVVAAVTVISYFHVQQSLQTQALEQLQKYVQERGMRESSIFVLAQDNLRAFAQEYAKRLQRLGDLDLKTRFDELFVERDDGSTRLRESFFTSDGITGFIGKYASIDAELQRRLVIGYEMLAQYGPAWQSRFANLYITTPEHAILLFWPGKPWGLNATSWEVNAKLALNSPGGDNVLIIDDSQRAARETTWSDLYFDYAVNDWMVSTMEPVNLAGRYMISVGHDLLLHELIERTIRNRMEGTYNILFRNDGSLLAHPRFMDAIQAQNGSLPINKAGDANLSRIFDLVKQRSLDSVAIINNNEDEEYLAATRLQGPGWYLVTVFPKAIIMKQAFMTARLILLLGAIALLLEIAISFFVLKKHLARPLTGLMEATNQIAAGDFDIHLDDRRPDEIGRLAKSLNTLSREISARESTLNERSIKLALLNQQLEQELAERERAEREIARQREALHQSEKLNALGSLLAGVAHELNNPLSVVVGRAIMLEGEVVAPELRAKVQKIRQAAERGARIVKTFLAIARQQPPERKPVALNTVLEAAIELMNYGLRTADITTTLDLDPDLPELSADADQLTQVFTNLIANAQQALLEVAPPRRLRITTGRARASRTVRITFTDNGPGVPEAARSRIFEPFYTSKPVGVGTGVGLSFSYGVIAAHGGQIALESPHAGGARFVVTLPLTLASSAPLPDPPLAPSGVPPRTILVVDDERDIADLLRELLASAGHRVDLAASGHQALRRLAQRSYDAILSDLKMPDLDGPGLYRRLQHTHPHLVERVAFISGDTLGMGASAFLAQTGRPLLEKPFIPHEVLQVVNQILNQSGSADADLPTTTR